MSARVDQQTCDWWDRFVDEGLYRADMEKNGVFLPPESNEALTHQELQAMATERTRKAAPTPSHIAGQEGRYIRITPRYNHEFKTLSDLRKKALNFGWRISHYGGPDPAVQSLIDEYTVPATRQEAFLSRNGHTQSSTSMPATMQQTSLQPNTATAASTHPTSQQATSSNTTVLQPRSRFVQGSSSSHGLGGR
ncbi:hypothetical protein [Streptomyces sp. WAC 01325]|uniref:hypothetical protein n=1 Tax=Streptomyces sp. WAC 01325 TaxID=2203202 RepID=UPI000F87A944|nr:hypothetical protein [Streptomyces sp. WAC 01325]